MDNSPPSFEHWCSKKRDALPSTFQVSSSGATFDNPRGMTVLRRVGQPMEAGLRSGGPHSDNSTVREVDRKGLWRDIVNSTSVIIWWSKLLLCLPETNVLIKINPLMYDEYLKYRSFFWCKISSSFLGVVNWSARISSCRDRNFLMSWTERLHFSHDSQQY